MRHFYSFIAIIIFFILISATFTVFLFKTNFSEPYMLLFFGVTVLLFLSILKKISSVFKILK